MPKQPVLTAAIVDKVGFGQNLLTLDRPVEIKPHPELLDDMVFLYPKDWDDPVCVDRAYLLNHELTLRHGSGRGMQVLAWTRPEKRHRNDDTQQPLVTLVVAIDLFLIGETKEFKRFCRFIENMSIQDTQAREFLGRKAGVFTELVGDPKGAAQVVRCLGHIVDTAETNLGFPYKRIKRESYQELATEHVDPLAAVRKAELVPDALMALDPQHRLNAFRLLCYVEDPDEGPMGAIGFLKKVAAHTRDEAVIERCQSIADANDLRMAFNRVRNYLTSPRIPGG